MKKVAQYLFFPIVIITLNLSGCSKSEDDPNPSPGPGTTGSISITEISPEYPTWGEKITITGTGFNTDKSMNYVWFQGGLGPCTVGNPNDSTGWRKAEILSASATKLEVKVPFTTQSKNNQHTIYDRPCGDEHSYIHVTSNGKTAVKTNYLQPFPFVNDVCISGSGALSLSPGQDLQFAIRVGLGFNASPYKGKPATLVMYDPLSLNSFSIPIDLSDPQSCGAISGGYFLAKLPQEIAEEVCIGTNGVVHDAFDLNIPTRMMEFKIVIQDLTIPTEYKDYFWVAEYPNYSVNPTSLPYIVNGSSLNPTIHITGQFLDVFQKAYFATSGPRQDCTGTETIALSPASVSNDKTSFDLPVPLSVLNPGCQYSLTLETGCGQKVSVGSLIVVL